MLYYAQQKFITVWQLNFLRILFTLGKLQPRAAKAKLNFSLKTSPACHPDPAAQAPGNGEGNCISSALPDLPCSGLLRKKDDDRKIKARSRKETSWQAGTETQTSIIFPLGKVCRRFRIYTQLLLSLTFPPLPFKQPLKVLTIWISNQPLRRTHLAGTGVVGCSTACARLELSILTFQPVGKLLGSCCNNNTARLKLQPGFPCCRQEFLLHQGFQRILWVHVGFFFKG